MECTIDIARTDSTRTISAGNLSVPGKQFNKGHGRRADSHLRALAKAASWRFGGAALTVAIAWVISGEARFAASMGAADVFVKFGCFYLHERVWDRINFGRAQKP